eukprot:6470581-Amphidinium_carterae.1
MGQGVQRSVSRCCLLERGGQKNFAGGHEVEGGNGCVGGRDHASRLGEVKNRKQKRGLQQRGFLGLA